jgi:two-component system, NtrC family, sensor kinase
MEKLEDHDGRVPILQNIKRHALNVSRIIRGIAYYLEEHRFAREKLPLIDLLNETVEYASYEIPKNVALSPHYDRVRAIVRGDRIWLRHTIDNILLNAFSAIERKSSEANGKVKLTTRLSSDRYYVEIYVTDSGGGIEKKDSTLDYIFDPGYTTNSRRRFLSGFGLSACRQIVHDHGGLLKVFSRVGRGTTFVIRLPVIGFEE